MVLDISSDISWFMLKCVILCFTSCIFLPLWLLIVSPCTSLAFPPSVFKSVFSVSLCPFVYVPWVSALLDYCFVFPWTLLVFGLLDLSPFLDLFAWFLWSWPLLLLWHLCRWGKQEGKGLDPNADKTGAVQIIYLEQKHLTKGLWEGEAGKYQIQNKSVRIGKQIQERSRIPKSKDKRGLWKKQLKYTGRDGK